MDERVTVILVLAGVAALLVAALATDDPDFATDLSVYSPLDKVHVQVVVARYAEDLTWLRKLPFHDIVVYNKNDRARDTTMGSLPPTARVVNLPNVGRCDHTYLYHIVTQWDNLADVTLFVPGSCPTFSAKWRKLNWVVAHISRTGGSAFPVDEVNARPVHEAHGSFHMDSYQATARINASANPENHLHPAEHRPFRVFFQEHFPEMPPVHEVMYKGVFAVSRQHIRQTPKKRYAKLMRSLGTHSNPEAGHFMERAWMAAFYPVPEECTSVTHAWDDGWDGTWFVLATAVVMVGVVAAGKFL